MKPEPFWPVWTRTANAAASANTPHRNRIVALDDLVLVREMVVDWDFRRDHVRDFELRLRAEPVLRIDDREIVAARFVEPRAPLAEAALPPFIRAHLGGARPDHRRPPTGA